MPFRAKDEKMSKGFIGPVTVPASTIDNSRSARLADDVT
jgi:hypothetical protein